MVISRTHYTCDVIIALLASKALFIFYHAFCEIDSLQQRKRSVLHSLCFTKIIFWLEENVDNQKLKNELEIPIIGNYLLHLHKENRRNNVQDLNKSMSSNSSITTAAVESVKKRKS
ncbi:unnamed protein product [Meloidogyne enterolobii]|uniref:Uncharacterized protein n=1 Tax=Meloidogyne enterolobii TaxID=390850 RepID=A0ACB1ARM7_MELEN